MSNPSILIVILCLVVFTAKAQLTDWQNISSKNFVTKITLDPKRDLIWLTHHPGLGLSVARLNSHNTAVQSIAAPNTANTAIYDLSGRKVTNSNKGIYIRQGKKFVKE